MSRFNSLLQGFVALAAGWLATVVIVALSSPLATAQTVGPNCNTATSCTKCTTTCAAAADCASGQCKCAVSNGKKYCQ